METDVSGCALPDRERLLLAYLGGTISAGEADAFEAHCMTCDACAAELERGVEIRSAVPAAQAAAGSATAGKTAGSRVMDWRWLGAAAAVVIVASVWRFSGTTPLPGDDTAPPVQSATPAQPGVPATSNPPAPSSVPTVHPSTPPRSRGSDDRTLRAPSATARRATAVREPNGNIRIEWPPVDKATSYVLKIFSVDGSQLLRREGTSPIEIAVAEVAVFGRADERLFATVDAVDAQGVTLSSSPRITIPARKEADRK